jgi:hypothetical protein
VFKAGGRNTKLSTGHKGVSELNSREGEQLFFYKNQTPPSKFSSFHSFVDVSFFCCANLDTEITRASAFYYCKKVSTLAKTGVPFTVKLQHLMTTKKLPNEWLLLSLHLPIKSGINFI